MRKDRQDAANASRLDRLHRRGWCCRRHSQPRSIAYTCPPRMMHDSQASRQSAARRKLNLARFWIGGEPRGAPSTRAQTGQRYALGNFQLVAGVQSASSRGPGFEHSLLLLLLLSSTLHCSALTTSPWPPLETRFSSLTAVSLA